MSIPNLPGVNVTIRDGALGSVAGLGSDACAVVGVCTGGTPNTVYQFTDIQTLKDTLAVGPTGGPAVEAAALILAVSGKPVVVVPTPNATAGDDILTGDAQPDVIDALEGDDIVFGGGGDDE